MTVYMNNKNDSYHHVKPVSYRFHGSWRFGLTYLVRSVILLLVWLLALIFLASCMLTALGGAHAVSMTSNEQQITMLLHLFDTPSQHLGLVLGIYLCILIGSCAFLILIWRTFQLIIDGAYYLLHLGNYYTVSNQHHGYYQFTGPKYQFSPKQIVGWTTKQSWLAQKFNYGTIYWYSADRCYCWRNIGNFDTLRQQILNVLKQKKAHHYQRQFKMAVTNTLNPSVIKEYNLRYSAKPKRVATISLLVHSVVALLLWLITVKGALTLHLQKPQIIPSPTINIFNYAVYMLLYIVYQIKQSYGKRYRLANGLGVYQHRFGCSLRMETCLVLAAVKLLKTKQGICGRFFNYGTLVWRLNKRKTCKWQLLPHFKQLLNQLNQ